MIRRRGNQPSSIACRVIEKAPVMMDWLAMIVASVASTMSGSSATGGHRAEEDVVASGNAVENDGGLSGVVQ